MPLTENIKTKLKALPDEPGCYLMRDRDGKIIYVGKAASLRKRVRSYFRQHTKRTAQPKIRSLISSIADFDIVVLKSEAEAILTEGKLIKEYRPHYNTLWKDDKRFVMIRVDVQHPFPTIGKCRIKKKDGAAYFGPYTSGMAAKVAVEFLERRFGLRRCRPREPDADTYKHCSNDIIANCSAPCVGKVTQEEYRLRVEDACAFLRGERMEMLKELRAEMETAALEHRFEDAAALRDMLLHLHHAVKEKAKVRKSPKMKQAEARLGLKELKKQLKLTAEPRVIECFDISNISGTNSVASMVCSVDGVPYPNRYRRFRIKTVEGADDPRSMAEVVRRRYSRLQRENKPMPELVMVDGGITQLRAAKAELLALGLDDLPIVGLAKRYEEVVWDYESNSGNLVLPRHSDGLTVVTRLRDEAHRFAITYHRDLRRQRIMESRLDEIPGIGNAKKEMLLKHFGSIVRLSRATVEQIAEAPGIGTKTAELIRSELDKK
ncbi:excinuclease ABC subunit UvrC [Pontiella sulfatireligans]|uniref:UvrABC system protein C n=1 Tax=Pontiella sulfatireligans TaxID=2750658 RepID=A0A6C2ULE7_9BACT|nr:excinuclease ABC subunit UvrC [Pontiella sulfatireligans]VGO20016.1 UvrABC system protein C [Pontiella sulfatireligans]